MAAVPKEGVTAQNYDVKPRLHKKFKPNIVKDIIHNVLIDKLQGEQYIPDNCASKTRDIADEIKNKLKVLDMERYKVVVQVVIGEQRGEGARMASRCLWDPETDNYAQDVYMNEQLFCCAAAFGVYLY